MPPTPITPTIYDAFYPAFASVGQRIESRSGVPLRMASRSFPTGTTLEDLDRKAAIADTVILSSDGEGYWSHWHQGASDEVAYVERWTLVLGAPQLEFHGYVDKASRKIVQTG